MGPLETRVLSYVQMREVDSIRAADLAVPLSLTTKQVREVLSRLGRAGMIAKIWGGLYLFPPKLPLGGRWAPAEALVLNTLMEDRGLRYQICGPNAFNRYGFDDQIPNRVYAYNDGISGERKIGSASFSFIKIAGERLGDIDRIDQGEGPAALYSSRRRTLLDAVYDWSRFNGIPRAYTWIRDEIRTGRTTAKDLVEVTLRFGNQGTLRRIGALLERLGAPERLLKQLDRRLRSSKSVISWVPSAPRRGPVSRRWGVVLNAEP